MFREVEKIKITINNELMIATFIISTVDPHMDELNKMLLSQGYPEHTVLQPLILGAVHEILAKVATDNRQSFDEVLQYMSETEKKFPAVGNQKAGDVSINYKYFGREKK